MTFRAGRTCIVLLADNLFVPLWPRRVGFVTPNALTVPQNLDLYIRVGSVSTSWAMASLAGKCLMLMLEQFLVFIRMTFFTGLLARKHRLPSGQFPQGFPSIPTVLFERFWRQKIARHAITADNRQSQQQQPDHLRSLEKAEHIIVVP